MALAALSLAGCRHESPAHTVVAFTVTENLDIGCAGIWSADRDGELRWLAGRDPSPVYPGFRHDGRLTVGLPTGRDFLGFDLLDIVAVEDAQMVARDVFLLGFTWSPRADQLLALRPARSGKLFSVVLVDAGGSRVRTIARRGHSPTWLGDGDAIAYLGGDDGEVLWRVGADGSGARMLARGVERFAASADGRRIAFRRTADESFHEELWVIDVATGQQRRIPGDPLADRSWSDVWAGPETLIVHDEFPDAGSDAHDAIGVDAGSGERSLVATDAAVLEASRDGSKLLAIREHLVVERDVEEDVIAVLSLDSDGSDEDVLAVTDAQNGNIHGIPILQPAPHTLTSAPELTPDPTAERRCRSELMALRERVDKTHP